MPKNDFEIDMDILTTKKAKYKPYSSDNLCGFNTNKKKNNESKVEKGLKKIIKLLTIIFKNPNIFIYLQNTNYTNYKNLISVNENAKILEDPLIASFCKLVIKQEDFFQINFPSNLINEKNENKITKEFNFKYFFGYPIKNSLGNNIGVICLLDKKTQKFSEAQIDSFKILAESTADKLELEKFYNDIAYEKKKKKRNFEFNKK